MNTKSKEICKIETCANVVKTKGYCNKHYLRLWSGRDLYEDPPKAIKGTCLVEECNKPVFHRGYCMAHHHRLLRYGDPLGKPAPRQKAPKLPCKINGCNAPRHGNHLCRKHYERYNNWGNPLKTGTPSRDMSTKERLFSKVYKHGEPPEFNPSFGECWLYLGFQGESGYGNFWFNGKNELVHRVAYKLEVGEIPEGFEIDHLCMNHSCVRPSHLEAVTPRENKRRNNSPHGINSRKTHCLMGHPLLGENLYTDPKGKRRCRACMRRKTQEKRKNLKKIGITERQINKWNKEWQAKLDAVD